MTKVPSKFFGLHAHDGSSAYDGLGPPKDHFEAAVAKGLDGHSLTNHGHMNSFANAYLLVQKWKKAGKVFKYVPGVEAYFHPDLNQWKKDKELADQASQDKKLAKKLKRTQAEGVITNIEHKTNADDETTEIETSNALTIENEDDTKGSKSYNPVNRRHHLVVLPKTSGALKKIFHLVSRSYLEGFYRFPRIDLGMLKEVAADHDIILSTACIGGAIAHSIFSRLREVKFDELHSSLLDDKVLLDDLIIEAGNVFDMLSSAVGRENVLLELQFNRLGAQDVVNRVILEFAKRNGLTGQLIAAPDSHYPTQELWKHREMYRKLGFMNYTDIGPESLPKSVDDLKAELYVKNAEDMWGEYQRSKKSSPFYGDVEDQLICDAIERTHDIAHNVIGDITFDTTPKFPRKLFPAGKTPNQHLVMLAKQGLIKRGFDQQEKYVERLVYELGIIKKMNVAEYFILLQKVMELARGVTLCGIARGSSGGSLVAYCLYITDLDPIKYDLQFERFLSPTRVGLPDIDVDFGDRDKVLKVLRDEFGFTNVIPISNMNLLKVKTLVKDISKFHGIPFDEVNEATKTVEQDVRKATLKAGDDKNLFVLTFDDAMKHSPSFKAYIDKHPEICESINVLFKEQRSLGRHAGGVVIMDDASKEMPLIVNGGEPQTPWVEGVGAKNLEPLGLIKLDALGLETMRLIERTIKLILEKRGVIEPTFIQISDWYNKHLHPDVNDYADKHVYENVYHKSRVPGIFQLTSNGSQRLFKEAKPENITDIAALTSIYRPGPLAAKVDKLYLKAKNEGEKFDWGHPLFEKALGKTYNLLIFQEQIMSLAEIVGGFPKEKCDDIRRAIMKRDLSKGDSAIKEAKKLEDDFVAGAMKNGVPESTARKSYQQILFYAGYGFNCLCSNTQVETKERGKIPIKDVIAGEHVLSENGWVEIIFRHKQGKNKVYELTTKSGKKLRCTLDHKIMTPDGLKTLNEIQKSENKEILVKKVENDKPTN